MLAVLIIIAVLGIGLPAGLWLVARRRKDVPDVPQVYGEVNQWLLREYGLGSRDRFQVQEAVLGRYAAVPALEQSARRPAPQAPASLRPDLAEAAGGLATRVAGDGFRRLRRSRGVGWVQLATGAAAAVFGVCVLAADWGGSRFFGVYAVLEAGLLGSAGAYTALIIPGRRCRAARNYLASAASAPATVDNAPAWKRPRS